MRRLETVWVVCAEDGGSRCDVVARPDENSVAKIVDENGKYLNFSDVDKKPHFCCGFSGIALDSSDDPLQVTEMFKV